eukprot:3705699-Prymnesium_polylepis.1
MCAFAVCNTVEKSCCIPPLQRTPLHQPYPVTRGLKSSTAIPPSTVYSSTALYSIQVQPLHHPSAPHPPSRNGNEDCLPAQTAGPGRRLFQSGGFNPREERLPEPRL